MPLMVLTCIDVTIVCCTVDKETGINIVVVELLLPLKTCIVDGIVRIDNPSEIVVVDCRDIELTLV